MKIPQELIEQFSRGNGAIFVGAGLSIGAGLPGWGQLIDRFAKELPDYPKESTYLDVAQYYVNQHGSNRLVNRLRDELDTSRIESTIVHDAVAQLGISPIFTTNFDNLIEKALLKESVKFDKVISDIDPNFWTNERTQLVKLHGDLDYPPSIVVTSENYERYLNDRPAFVRLLTIALQTKTTLFLGYSASDIDVRSLLTLIQNEAGEYARNAFSLMFDAHQLVVQDLERRGIKVINFENVPNMDKNQILGNWLNALKDEVEKYSRSTSKGQK